MKQMVILLALAALTCSGCATGGMLARKGCCQPCHVARSQTAPRPAIQRASYCDAGGCALGGGCCDSGCCGDCCCDSGGVCGCGCPDDCCGCGCPDDCCGCGCPDDCCTCDCADNCCGCGCPDACCGCDCCGECTCGCPGSGCCGGGCCVENMCRRMVGSIASGCCPHSGGYPEMYNFTPSPPVGQVAYPYYTTRGPRDFLQNNPPSIGPY